MYKMAYPARLAALGTVTLAGCADRFAQILLDQEEEP